MASSCLLQRMRLFKCETSKKLIKKDHLLMHESPPWICLFSGGLNFTVRSFIEVPLHGRLFAQWMHHVYPQVSWWCHINGRHWSPEILCDANIVRIFFGRCCFDPNHIVECSRYICIYTSKNTSVHMLPCQTYINVYIIYSQYMHKKGAISIDNAKYAHILSFSTHIFWTFFQLKVRAYTFDPFISFLSWNKGQKLSHVKNNRPYI